MDSTIFIDSKYELYFILLYSYILPIPFQTLPPALTSPSPAITGIVFFCWKSQNTMPNKEHYIPSPASPRRRGTTIRKKSFRILWKSALQKRGTPISTGFDDSSFCHSSPLLIVDLRFSLPILQIGFWQGTFRYLLCPFFAILFFLPQFHPVSAILSIAIVSIRNSSSASRCDYLAVENNIHSCTAYAINFW